MSKEIIDHGFGVIETRETFYTEETIRQKDQQIADLEEKLAESENEHELLINDFEEETEKLRKQIKQESDARERFVKKVEELKQQLAEKGKENKKITRIVAYRDDMDMSTTINGVKFSDEQIITLQNIDYFTDKHNQDKISFAVDVLKIAQDYVRQYVNDFDDMNDCLCAIDNQIKQLTHQHEDKGE